MEIKTATKKQIAQHYGIANSTVTQWSDRGQLPEPIGKPGRGAKYDMVEVQAFRDKVLTLHKFAKDAMLIYETHKHCDMEFRRMADAARRLVLCHAIPLDDRMKMLTKIKTLAWQNGYMDTNDVDRAYAKKQTAHLKEFRLLSGRLEAFEMQAQRGKLDHDALSELQGKVKDFKKPIKKKRRKK